MNTLGAADYTIIAGFFLVMLGIGAWFGQRVRTMSQFFGGGRQVPWWLGGVSFYMVSFSALAFIMYSELVYKYGLVGLALGWLSVPAAVLSARLFARRWRRVAQTSPLEYLQTRYGGGLRQSLVWLGLPTRLLDDSLRLFAIGTVVSAGLGFPFTTGILLCSAIILAYTFMGGLWAALVADFVQFAILLAAVAPLPWLALERAGGLAAVLAAMPPEGWRLVRPDTTYNLPYLVGYFVLLFLNYSTSWALVQRYYSCSSDHHARRVGYLVAALYLVGTALFYSPALAARAFLAELANTKEVYPLLCRAVLPAGMLGMLIAAMFSATMSTLAGDYNAVASVLTNDLYRRWARWDVPERRLVIVGRVFTVLVGLAVSTLTLLMSRLQGSRDLFDTMAKVFGLFLPPVAIPMLAGMLWPRASATGAKLALWSGIAAGLAAFGLGAAHPLLRRADLLTFLTGGIALAALTAGSYARPDRGEARARVDAFFERLRSAGAAADARAPDYSFLRLVAAALATMGALLLTAVLTFVVGTPPPLSASTGIALLLAGALLAALARRPAPPTP
ncbi:MAG: hypothetical protein N2652_09745 [Kiritimatiellae bacterium]|nr:hypothetical protein [Kiritimatiellia bacterium]